MGLMLLWAGAVLVAAGLGFSGRSAAAGGQESRPAWADAVVRLHVVANSDSAADQALKRAVRDAILEEVTPLFEGAQTRAEALAAVAVALPRIERVAAATVRDQGRTYQVRAEVGRFRFPGKAYGLVYLPAGEYDALRVVIGEGRGANWWCILFPPMCFLDWSTGIVLEPDPSTGGAETVVVPREEVTRLLDEEQLEEMPVRARLAFLEWLKSLGEPPPEAPDN